MKIIIQGDGGSWRGAALLENLKAVERGVGKKCYEFADLISGCSTFAIAGSCLAAGVSAADCQKLYLDNAKQIFNAKSRLLPWNWGKPLFDRQIVLNILKRSFLNSQLNDANPLMKQLLTKFMCTSVSLLDTRNHFFKSWEDKDGNEPVIDVVARSFAAALFFGALDDPVKQQIWADGGEGINNCTLDYCVCEAFRQGWTGEGVYILSLGCGQTNNMISYSRKSSVLGNIDEILTYFKKLGANQSVTDQVILARQIGACSKITVDRLDFVMPSSCDSFSAYQHIPDVIKLAQEQCSALIPQVVANIKKALS